MAKKVLIISRNHGSKPRCLDVLGSMAVEVDLAHNPLAAYPRLWRGGYRMIIAEMEDDLGHQEECLKLLWQAKKNIPDIGIIIMADFCGEDLERHAKELGVSFLLRKDASADIWEKALSSLVLAGPEERPNELPAGQI